MTDKALLTKLRVLAKGWRDRVDVDPTDPYTEGESHALFECAQTLTAAIHDVEATQPPHHDRGDTFPGSAEHLLRAMVRNYGNGHAWDKLDAAACTQAADEIASLRAALTEAKQQGPGEAVISGKYGDVLRPFVIAMDKELHANAGKGDRPGWLRMTPETALLEIYYHLSKLQKAVRDDNGPGIQEYAADVANMSMMLLDICGGLALIEYAAPAASGGEDKRDDGLVTPYPVAPMGHGVITIGEGHVNGVRALIFGNRGSGVFGEEAEGNRGMADGETICAITFANPEAVDLLRSYLEFIAANFDIPDARVQPRSPMQHQPQLPSGASVSERAKELLALSCDKYGWWKLAQILRGTAEGRLHEREVIALSAIERALSSPRQEGDSTAASTQGLRELVQRWRHEARDMIEIHGSDQTFVCVADALEKMADELESLLTSPTTGADGGA